MLTVACVWVKANVPYSVDYVTRLRAMVSRNLSRPHRFVCITDRPADVPDVETIRIDPLPNGISGWWAKMDLFAGGRFSGRVLYLDLDTLVVRPLDPIVDFASPFALIPHAGTFTPRTHHRVVRRFNSSVMVWDADVPREMYEEFAHSRETFCDEYWGDQDLIGALYPQAETMPLAWFPRLSQLQGKEPGKAAIVVLAKKPKNDEAAKRWPWVDQVWRAA